MQFQIEVHRFGLRGGKRYAARNSINPSIPQIFRRAACSTTRFALLSFQKQSNGNNGPERLWQFPKKNFLKDFLIAIAEGDEPFLAEHVSDGIIWENIGIKKVETKSLYLKELPNHPLWKTDQLAVDKIITHGTDAAAHGIFHAPDGSAHAFCDIYLFKGFKSLELLSIKSFLIPLT